MRLQARIPEPELMDDREQARAYSEADFEVPHTMFVSLFREKAGLAEVGDPRLVLDLGCGPADVTTRFASAHPTARVVAIDASEPMLALGRTRVCDLGLGERVELLNVRLTEPAEKIGDGPYDCVISNSLLHHLPDGGVLWATVTANISLGGFVFVMDLMRPDSTEDAARLVDEHAGGEPDVLRDDFRNSLCAAFTLAEVRSQLSEAGLALQVEEVSDRHLLVWGRVDP
ncbi:MAG: class I SAM-dependent methyltransferase [Actinobacteria bacterium ATB1]|nr:class I SAM-dependent methyltransferase [Actinobacteria bacterium ATB1]